jgi:hypothetical protein
VTSAIHSEEAAGTGIVRETCRRGQRARGDYQLNYKSRVGRLGSGIDPGCNDEAYKPAEIEIGQVLQEPRRLAQHGFSGQQGGRSREARDRATSEHARVSALPATYALAMYAHAFQLRRATRYPSMPSEYKSGTALRRQA